jgi:AcrR family transcriptional regulator
MTSNHSNSKVSAEPPTRQIRRTQKERAEETQSLLLEATIACLSEVGYAKTTTTLVAQRAGVSRGAQTHHFPNKISLVIAALERLSESLVEALDKGLADCLDKPDVLDAFMRGIWRTKEGPLFACAMEVAVAARHDSELREIARDGDAKLREIINIHVKNTAKMLRPHDPKPVEIVLHQSVLLVHAFALAEMFDNQNPSHRVLFDAMTAKVREVIAD